MLWSLGVLTQALLASMLVIPIIETHKKFLIIKKKYIFVKIILSLERKKIILNKKVK